MTVSIRTMLARRLLSLCLAAASGGMASPAVADSVAATVGVGFSRSPNQIYLSYQRDWARRWLQYHGWHMSGSWDLGMGVLHGGSVTTGLITESALELGATPVLRMQRDSREGIYFEAGVGIYLLSTTRIGTLDLGSVYQFGSRMGLGFRFGSEQTFDVSYHIQHMSNGSLKAPNDGAEFHLIRAQYHF